MDPNNYMEDVGKNLSLTPTGFYDLKVSLFFLWHLNGYYLFVVYYLCMPGIHAENYIV